MNSRNGKESKGKEEKMWEMKREEKGVRKEREGELRGREETERQRHLHKGREEKGGRH